MALSSDHGRKLGGQRLVIRADATPSIGTGHMMRCLAVAQEWLGRGGTVTLITRCGIDALQERFADEGADIVQLEATLSANHDLEITERTCRLSGNPWLILDGYHFDVGFQYALVQAGHRLVVIDDNAHLPEYYADIILNQNLHAHAIASRYPASARLLLGARFVLLRREFRNLPGGRSKWPRVAQRLLILAGGSDPGNVTPRLLEALSRVAVEGLEVRVVVGVANPHRDSVHEAARRVPFRVTLEPAPRNMAELMSWADFAVSGAGSATWELMYMGVPTVLIVLADNQRASAERIAAAGLAAVAGEWRDLSEDDLARTLENLAMDRDARAMMSSRCSALVDGHGAKRLVDVLLGEKG